MVLSGHACRRGREVFRTEMWFIFLVKHLENCVYVSASCAVEKDISTGFERGSWLRPEQAVQMSCVTVYIWWDFLNLTLFGWDYFSESFHVVTRKVFKLSKCFWMKSQVLHSPEQDLYGAWAKGFPFLFILIHYEKPCLNSVRFFPFHFLLFSFHPLYLPPPPTAERKKTKGVQEWQKREFVSFLPFLSSTIPMRTLQHALSQTDTDTKSIQVQPCHTLLLTDKLQPWISCFHAI